MKFTVEYKFLDHEMHKDLWYSKRDLFEAFFKTEKSPIFIKKGIGGSASKRKRWCVGEIFPGFRDVFVDV